MKFIKSILSWIVPTIIALLIYLVIKIFFFEFVIINGPSMQPSLSNKEVVTVVKNKKFVRGDVIVFNAYPEDPKLNSSKKYVKRIIGIPGDTVSSRNGSLYVNGKKVNQSYISEFETEVTGDWNLSQLATENNWKNKKKVEITNKVPANEYFVLGDNREVSNDSRYWGFVPKSKISGTVYIPFWGKESQQKNVNDYSQKFFKQ